MNKYQYSAVDNRWKWTPMEESVPPERLRNPATGILECLVSINGHTFSSAYWSRKDGWYCIGGGCNSLHLYQNRLAKPEDITHWMPKPPINPDWKPRR